MSLLFFDAMQECDVVVKPEWDALFKTHATGRDGTANGASSPGGGIDTGQRLLTLPSAAATCIVGFAVAPGQLVTQAFSVYFKDSAGTNQLLIMMNSSGRLEARVGSTSGTLLATSSGHTPIGASDFPSIQIKCVLHTSAGSAEVLLNGVSVLSVSGVATSTLNSSVYKIMFYSESGSNRAQYDDLWVCDAVDATATQGQANDDYLGDLTVAVLVPSGAGDSTDFTPSTGSNYACVDEIPLSTTDYVSSDTPGDIDLYAMTNLPAGVTTVFGVQATYVADKSDAGDALLAPVLKETGGTVTTEDPQGLGTTFGAITGELYAAKPSDGDAWDVSDVNAIQVGQEVA